MMAGLAVSKRKGISMSKYLTIALLSCAVLLPSETRAQRAAVGIGSKWKQTIFGGRTSRDGTSRSETRHDSLEGEQDYDIDNVGDSNGMASEVLWKIATDKPGIAMAMMVMLCGYAYLFLHQRQKIDQIEKAIAGGECQVSGLHMIFVCSIVNERRNLSCAFVFTMVYAATYDKNGKECHPFADS